MGPCARRTGSAWGGAAAPPSALVGLVGMGLHRRTLTLGPHQQSLRPPLPRPVDPACLLFQPMQGQRGGRVAPVGGKVEPPLPPVPLSSGQRCSGKHPLTCVGGGGMPPPHPGGGALQARALCTPITRLLRACDQRGWGCGPLAPPCPAFLICSGCVPQPWGRGAMRTATHTAGTRTRAPPVHAMPRALMLAIARARACPVTLAVGGMAALVVGCPLPLRRAAMGPYPPAAAAAPVSMPPVAGLPPLAGAAAATAAVLWPPFTPAWYPSGAPHVPASSSVPRRAAYTAGHGGAQCRAQSVRRGCAPAFASPGSPPPPLQWSCATCLHSGHSYGCKGAIPGPAGGQKSSRK